MTLEILLGAGLGVLIGFLLTIPAIYYEKTRRRKDLPLLMDIHHWWGKKMTDGEIFVLAMLVHMLQSIIFGGLYPYLVHSGVISMIPFDPYGLPSLVIYAVVYSLIIGLIVFPAIGFGIMARKEPGNTWEEFALAMILLTVLYWLSVQWFQPLFFLP